MTLEEFNIYLKASDSPEKRARFLRKHVFHLPPFIFANDVNPWCNCQDHDDWNKVEVRIIKLANSEGELEWTWGNLNADSHSSWKDFAYRFRVVKENGKWKIAYLQGFEFKESTRKDGEL